MISKIFFIFVLLNLAFCFDISEEEIAKEFGAFVKDYKKEYDSVNEIIRRHEIFRENYRYIKNHNNFNYDFKLAVNQFADLTLEEFKQLYLTKKGEGDSIAKACSKPHVKGEAKAEIDWRKRGVVSPIKNQGNCGSCWAFSTVGVLESLHAIKKGALVEFSEQELIDCTHSYGNKGCIEGEMSYSFEYVKDKGISTRREYRYEGREGACRKKSNTFQITGCVNITRDDNDMLLEALNIGPVSVWVKSDNRDFIYYRSGIIKSGCGVEQDELDHGLTLIGASFESGTPFWIAKNSWGSNWGEDGYVRIKRDTGKSHGICGIAIENCYPVIR